MRRGQCFLLAGSALALATAVQASETVTYSYDSLGRLIRVERGVTDTGGVKAEYSYDPADNRTKVTVDAAATPVPAPSPPPPAALPPPPPGGAA
jgi:hypothetical protein